MKREIKFRAWDPKYNQVIYGGEIWKRYPNWYPVDYVTNKGVTIWNKRQNNDPENIGEFERLKIFPEIVIMQFTGLKDKHGNDIYEGDIVETKVNDTVWVHEVFWDNDCGRFLCRNKDGGNVIQHGNFTEIVGNIYQTPKLLTPPQEVVKCTCKNGLEYSNCDKNCERRGADI